MRGRAVQQIVAQHTRFVQQRVVVEYRADIAPVPIEVVVAEVADPPPSSNMRPALRNPS